VRTLSSSTSSCSFCLAFFMSLSEVLNTARSCSLNKPVSTWSL